MHSVYDTVHANFNAACGLSSTAYGNGYAAFKVVNIHGSILTLDSDGPHPASGDGYMNPCNEDGCSLDAAARVSARISGTDDARKASLDFSECPGGDAPLPPSGGQGEDGTQVCYDVYYNLLESDDGGATWYLVDSWYLGTECWLYGQGKLPRQGDHS